ncbi:MAG: rhodanese-like domain-containing protein [Candidatus Kryptonium sp.]|nr:rhodanese-like domain-containing protein [Candidatus Kryptonium sp.]MCX7762977.1 rhodanese-like domain-containing protein [Candidatus Kryptonium sp.]MDW8108578.1 rhodanese-like domain-containing protein [Candidatus Kryptonium sp.]
MKNFSKFLILILFAVYFSSCAVKLVQQKPSIYTDITPIEAQRKIEQNKKVLILDVRTKEEFSEWHLKNAVNIPVQELEGRLDELEKYKDFEIIVYCKGGVRSKMAGEILVKNGFKYVYNLSGGINEWKKQFEAKQ